MNDFDLRKYLGNNPLITEYGEDEFDRSPEMYSGGKSDREGPDELSLKVGEPVIYQGRKAIFKRHGHPGKTAHIEVDDEYIEVPVSKLKKDPDYDYTKASPHAVKKI